MRNDRYLVLVVEDDEEMNALEREFLEVSGIRTAAAYTGREALEMCETRGVDAVLLDVMLPERDGFDTCRILRKHLRRRLPIVLLTALEGPEYVRRGKEAGADAYFTKPFDPDEVVSKIRELLHQEDAAPDRDPEISNS